MRPNEASKPVTELALLHIKSTADVSATRSALLSAAKAQADYAKYPVHLFKQVEDPSYIYLLGGWSSIAAHLDDWIPGPTNQALMASLMDKLEVEWMIHIDIDPTPLQRAEREPAAAAENDQAEAIPLNAPVLGIGRYLIAANQEEAFLNKFQEKKGLLKSYVAPRTLKGGIRVAPKDKSENGAEKEEFVLFSGWGEVQDHLRFAETKEFKEFKTIMNFMEGAEIKHASLWLD
ncbi:hypothetical protein BDV29DRAFT_18345 [Aspergillus leporis]|uniref:ABM domain-containing protein n=1 Tax=Aspergillus leporis TaxID=41062 RepID=A0A5N5WW98_9EURO|nr:hypothetical protein BDV29DRAFT_18345 [Aspergillus leporis]